VRELPVLDATDQRILGSLLEKQTTVPATYPLSANALVSACNQTSSRDPVTDLDQQIVERTAKSLKERGLLRIVWSDTGRRTLKYHQILDEHLALEPDERALLTVLLLRGAQAPGELRTRTERLHGFRRPGRGRGVPAPDGEPPATAGARDRASVGPEGSALDPPPGSRAGADLRRNRPL
jgi:uncharacterized protein YceH (UPF0502 family)